MEACLTSEQIERYRRGVLASPEELASADTHLARCARCRASLRDAAGAAAGGAPRLARSLLGTDPAPPGGHLDDDLIARYAEGTADPADRELVEAHAVACPRCAGDVADLRAFAAEMRGYDWSAGREDSANLPLWRRIFAPPPKRARRLAFPAAALAVAGAALVAAYVVSVRPLAREAAALRAELSRERERAETLRRAAAASAAERAAAGARLAALEAENARAWREARRREAALRDLRGRIASLTRVAEVPRVVGSPPSPPGGSMPGRPPAFLAALRDGGRRVTVDARGAVAGLPAETPDALREAVRDALRSRGRVAVSTATRALARPGREGVLLGGTREGGSFALRQPVGTAVAGPLPAFRWQPVDGALDYTVTVVDDDAQEELPPSPPLARSEWSPDADALPGLKPGRTYRWYVVARMPDGGEVQAPRPPAPVARFRVLGAAEAREVGRARNSLAGSHLALGVAYARAGLLDDAEREFGALLRANPTSEIARNLLGSVRQLRPAPPTPEQLPAPDQPPSPTSTKPAQ